MKVSKALPVSLLALALMALAAKADSPALPAAATADQVTTSKLVYGLLSDSRYAYRPRALDDALSQEVLTEYLKALDPAKVFFTAQDVAGFQAAYANRLDDAIKSGQVDPAWAIFSVYRQRVDERTAFARKQLKGDFDFSKDERYEYDRKDAPWADAAALDALWRQSVKNDWLRLKLAGKQPDEIRKTLDKRYAATVKSVDQLNGSDAFQTFLNAYTNTIDPHTDYFNTREAERFNQLMSQSLEGIGAQLQKQDDVVVIRELIPGGPALLSGKLKAGDRIVAVGRHDGPATQDVIGWRIDDVVQLIRGKGGTLVRLRVLPGGAAPGTAEKTLAFTRNKVTLEAQAAQKSLHTIERGGRSYRIGVINVPGFYQDIAAQNAGDADYRSTTREALAEFKKTLGPKLNGLVLDLRGNGGGYLPEATAFTGLFIDRGPVVQLRDAGGRTEVLDDPDPGVAYTGPLAVLVDRFSASASEIFAGAIQDYRRGVVLGQQTFGKGTVQNLVPLDGYARKPVNGQLTVTIGKFYRVTGESTQLRGVSPDVPLASLIDLKDVGESALDEALPWDRIPGVPYRAEQGDGVVPAVLASEEGARAAADPDYRWLVADIAAVQEVRRQTSVSLNLKARQEERATLDRDRLARENKRRAALGQVALKSVEEIKTDEAPDIVLDQATEVMADMVGGPMGSLAPKTVSRTP